jgi:hypothetical protein
MKKAILLSVILLIPVLVLAGTISLTTSVTTDVLTQDEGEIQVTLTNSGDEAAYNVQLSLITDFFLSEPVYVGTLDINKPFRTNLTVEPQSELKEGNYPVVLLTEYSDANGYPFSSVSPVTLTYKNPHPSRVTGVFENIEVSGNRVKNLVLKLKNMDQVSHEVDVKLILPNELSSDITQESVTIDSKEEKKLTFRISNFAGLEGSNYVVLATIEYEDEYHHSSLSSGMVKIVEGKGWNIPTWVPIIAVGVLVVIFVAYQVKNRFTIKFEKEEKSKEEKPEKEKNT